MVFQPIAGPRNLRPEAELARLMVSGIFWDAAGRLGELGDDSADRGNKGLDLIGDLGSGRRVDPCRVFAASGVRARRVKRGSARRLLGRYRSRSAFTASSLFFRSRRPRRRADVPGRALPMMAEPSAAGGSHWTRFMDTHRERSREGRVPRQSGIATRSVSPEASTRK